MAYSKVARELRECLGTRKNGEPCRAWAVWDDPRQLCVAHAGRHHTGPMPRVLSRTKPAKYKPCCCPAYNWLHRPGGGLCRWPDVPEYRLTTPQGTKSPARSLLSLGREMRLMRMALEELRFWEEPYPKREPELQHEKSDAHASGELDADDQPSPYEGTEEGEYEYLKERYGEDLAELLQHSDGC
jgi:hypothetical protein